MKKFGIRNHWSSEEKVAVAVAVSFIIRIQQPLVPKKVCVRVCAESSDLGNYSRDSSSRGLWCGKTRNRKSNSLGRSIPLLLVSLYLCCGSRSLTKIAPVQGTIAPVQGTFSNFINLSKKLPGAHELLTRVAFDQGSIKQLNILNY